MIYKYVLYNFPKIQMPGGLPGGGMLKLRIDWYIRPSIKTMHNTFNNIFFKIENSFLRLFFALYHSLQSFTLTTIVDKAGDPGSSKILK